MIVSIVTSKIFIERKYLSRNLFIKITILWINILITGKFLHNLIVNLNNIMKQIGVHRPLKDVSRRLHSYEVTALYLESDIL